MLYYDQLNVIAQHLCHVYPTKQPTVHQMSATKENLTHNESDDDTSTSIPNDPPPDSKDLGKFFTQKQLKK
jgi:hypothetical protein